MSDKYTIGQLLERKDIPRAHSFVICYCDNPMCGPHIIGIDAQGEPMCEMVIAQRSIMGTLEALAQGLGRDEGSA